MRACGDGLFAKTLYESHRVLKLPSHSPMLQITGNCCNDTQARPRVIFICPINNKHAETNITPPASVIQSNVLQSLLTHPVFSFNPFLYDPLANFFIALKTMYIPPSGIQLFIRKNVKELSASAIQGISRLVHAFAELHDLICLQ